MNEKVKLVADLLHGSVSMTEICDFYDVSTKTGYKWLERYMKFGPAGLEELSRKPHDSPNATDPKIVKAILDFRRHHPTWGGKKILTNLHTREPNWELPCRSTVCDILKRNGLLPTRKYRRRIGHPGKPASSILAPNDVWSADFKGQFKTRDGIYCFPLTITDNFSRYILCCQGLPSTAISSAKIVFTRIFQEFGLPTRIRTDNGVPFASNSLARLSTLSAWWVRLGIIPELIEPGKPQQNGRHERMHRTLKAETTRPPAGNMSAQQRRFNHFREEFNEERPHEALDLQTPSSLYVPSLREMPSKIPPLTYPDRFEVRYVSADGSISWNKGWVYVSSVCSGEYIGLEEFDDGIWSVYYGPLKIGRFHERLMHIEDDYGRLNRRNV
jgi:transposase InsO family protein